MIGAFGYVPKAMYHSVFSSQPWMKITPQASVAQGATFISSDQFLTMRDYDRFSRVVITDWRDGSGQVTFDPSTKADLTRYYDSTNADISTEGEVSLTRAFAILYSGDTSTVRKPMCIAGQYLYVASQTSVKFSSAADWSAPTSAATNTTGTIGDTIGGLCSDGQYVYGAVASGGGSGINRWAIGSNAAGARWNTTSTTPARVIYANRRIYAIDAVNFYEVAIASAVGTTQFTLPTGWVMQDICALRGGAIDAPILILATNGAASTAAQSAIWYWDGVTIRDYMTLPNGVSASRLKSYLGVTYISGFTNMASGNAANLAYAIVNGNLANLGFIAGLAQANGDPAEHGVRAAIDIECFGTSAYFLVLNATTAATEIWRYAIDRGGWSRYASLTQVAFLGNDGLIYWQGGLWVGIIAVGASVDRLLGQQVAFASLGTIVNSDLNLGQPWASNLWASLELTFAPLAAGESVQAAYSLDGGATYTTTDATAVNMLTTTLGATTAKWLISNTTGSAITPYIRPKIDLGAGTSQLTSPSFYAISIKAIPAQPAGNVIECWLACPDKQLQPNGAEDWQGASGSERLYNIENLYLTQALTSVIYMAPGPTRAKNPKTISAIIDSYEIALYPPEGFKGGMGPPIGVEGDIHVVLREVVTG